MDILSSPFKAKAAKVSPVSSPTSSSTLNISPVGVYDLFEDDAKMPSSTARHISPVVLFRRDSEDSFYGGYDHVETLRTEISRLRASITMIGAVESLKEIFRLVSNLPSSERNDFLDFFRMAISFISDIFPLKKYMQLIPFIRTVLTEGFHLPSVDDLPTIVLQEIMQWLTYDEAPRLATVSKYWRTTSYDDALWKCFYHRKFTTLNPSSSPSIHAVEFRRKFRLSLY